MVPQVFRAQHGNRWEDEDGGVAAVASVLFLSFHSLVHAEPEAHQEHSPIGGSCQTVSCGQCLFGSGCSRVQGPCLPNVHPLRGRGRQGEGFPQRTQPMLPESSPVSA